MSSSTLPKIQESECSRCLQLAEELKQKNNLITSMLSHFKPISYSLIQRSIEDTPLIKLFDDMTECILEAISTDTIKVCNKKGMLFSYVEIDDEQGIVRRIEDKKLEHLVSKLTKCFWKKYHSEIRDFAIKESDIIGCSPEDTSEFGKKNYQELLLQCRTRFEFKLENLTKDLSKKVIT
jgi:hypothetical protein